MPFCSKCGLFFAKGNVCSCVSGLSPAEAARNARVAVPDEKPVVAPASAAAAEIPRTKKTAPKAAPVAPIVSPRSVSSDRGAVVAETSQASSKYCPGCSEPRTLCKCAPEEGEPFYGRKEHSNQTQVSSAAFCSGCSEPRALCTCKTAAPAPTISPRSNARRIEARDESNAQYNEPAKGTASGRGEVSKEATVMGGNKFCSECGEPTKLCRCQSIREGRQIVDPVTGKWL